ncbi:hypothetical protein IWQ55_000308 [Labrenzia sp. EL_208]|nr:hypothetical protein [Labrenzia sp. EL_208]
MGGGKNASSKAADEERRREQERQERIRSGTASVNSTFDGQFTDDFFTGREDAYVDYASPQLDQQHQSAQQDLAFALARGGTANSSVRAQKEAELAELYDVQKRQISDNAAAQANETRTAVEDARGDLIRTLNATGDATAASNQALARAQALSQPEAYSPLEQLFVDFTAGLGTQAALERASSYEGSPVKPRYSTGLFGTRAGAVSNV